MAHLARGPPSRRRATGEEPERDEGHGEDDEHRGDHGAGEAGEPPGVHRGRRGWEGRRRRGEPELEQHDAREVGEREEHEDDGDGGVEGGAARRVGPVDGLEKRLDELMMRELPSATQSANWGASLRSAIRAAETKRCKTEGRMEIRGENSDWLDLSPPCGCRLLEGSSGVDVWSRGGVANACTPATDTNPPISLEIFYFPRKFWSTLGKSLYP